MKPSAEKAELLRRELQAWLKLNSFSKGTVWRTADEYYGEAHKDFAFYHYYVLEYTESDLYDVMNDVNFGRGMGNSLSLFDQIEEIVRRHGFWFERQNDSTASILGDERDEAS